jgi:hypothetical protein
MAITNELHQEWTKFRSEHGHAEAREILLEVAGCSVLSAVPEDKFADVIAAFKNYTTPDAGKVNTRQNSRSKSGSKPVVLDHKKIFAHWNSFTGKREE